MQTIPTNTKDIFIVQNSSFSVMYDVPNVNQFLFYACIRKTPDDDAFIEFAVDANTTDNTVLFSLDPDKTGLLRPKTYLYQMMMKNQIDQTVSVLAQGNAIVDAGAPFGAPGTSSEVILNGGTF